MDPVNMDARRALTLANGLPSEALIYGGWGVDQELRAQTVEMLDAVRIQVAQLTRNTKAKKLKPLRLPRPESVRPKKKNSWVEFAKSLRRQVGGD